MRPEPRNELVSWNADLYRATEVVPGEWEVSVVSARPSCGAAFRWLPRTRLESELGVSLQPLTGEGRFKARYRAIGVAVTTPAPSPRPDTDTYRSWDRFDGEGERAPHHWTPEMDALLGTNTDAVVGEQLGLKPSAVRSRRLRLGIRGWGNRGGAS